VLKEMYIENGIKVKFLPSYSPDFNSIEGILSWNYEAIDKRKETQGVWFEDCGRRILKSFF
jgi:transposase